MDKFYDHVTSEYGLMPKVAWKASHAVVSSPSIGPLTSRCVACIYNDAPVCDFKSWPGGKGKGKGSPADWSCCLDAYGLTEPEALAYKLNPVDNLAPLAKLNFCSCTSAATPTTWFPSPRTPSSSKSGTRRSAARSKRSSSRASATTRTA